MKVEHVQVQPEVEVEKTVAEKLTDASISTEETESKLHEEEEAEIRQQLLSIVDSRAATTLKVQSKKGSDDGEPKSSLSRSHSAPNIAKMWGNVAPLSSGPLAKLGSIAEENFSRTNKPASKAEVSHARKRDFHPIWSTSVVKGRTGLKNLGNSCYMNSILQCLSNLAPLATYFMQRKYLNQFNDNSETCGTIAIEFSELLRALWSGQFKSISPVDFKKAMGSHLECFDNNEQQDAHELLSTLMGCLHNDTNEVKDKVKQ